MNKRKKIEKKHQNKNLFYSKNNFFNGNNYFYYERKGRGKRKVNEKMNLSYNRKINSLKNDIDCSNKNMDAKNNINEIKEISNKLNKNEFNFCKYLSYIMCCGRKNQKMNFIEELRHQVLSEETIVLNYLNLKEMNKLSEFVK